MKEKITKQAAAFFIVALMFLSLAVPAFAAKTYDADAAIRYAKAHWNDGKGLCAEFVSKCLKAGGCPIASNGASTLAKRLKNSGYGIWEELEYEQNGYIKVSKNENRFSIGDPVFFYCPSCLKIDGCPYVHTALYSGTDSNGNMTCYAHNASKNNEVIRLEYCAYCHGKISTAYVYHMNHSSAAFSPESTPQKPVANTPEYFACKVQISCKNGQTVNLYNAPGESKRADYLSKGQTVESIYKAQFDDGTTWYQIAANASGTARKFWLKYDSNKMTVKDIVPVVTYTMRFDAGDGFGAPPPQSKEKGADLILSTVRPSRDGYVFCGWTTSDGALYQPGDSYTADRDETFYAVWIAVDDNKPSTPQPDRQPDSQDSTDSRSISDGIYELEPNVRPRLASGC